MKILVKLNKNIATPKQIKTFKVFDLGTVTTSLNDLLNNSYIEIDSDVLPILKINEENGIKYYLINALGETPNLIYPYYTDDFTKEITINDLILINNESNGEANIQSDWNQEDPYEDSFIKNKPYIPIKTSDLINDGENGNSTYVEQDSLSDVAFSNDYNDLDNIPSTFPPSSHTHTINDIESLVEILETKADVLKFDTYADFPENIIVDTFYYDRELANLYVGWVDPNYIGDPALGGTYYKLINESSNLVTSVNGQIGNVILNIPTKTSDLENNGADGINPFITESYIPTLNEVLEIDGYSERPATVGDFKANNIQVGDNLIPETSGALFRIQKNTDGTISIIFDSVSQTDSDNFGRLTSTFSNNDGIEFRHLENDNLQGSIIRIRKDSILLTLINSWLKVNKDGIDRDVLLSGLAEITDILGLQSALDNKADLVGGLVPSSQLPPTVDEILEYNTFTDFPTTGENNKYYLALNTNKTYRWGGTTYVAINEGIALGETLSTAYRGDRGKIAYDHSQIIGNPHGVTKTNVGLSNVDNTSDINKPISIATQNALNLKVDKGLNLKITTPTSYVTGTLSETEVLKIEIPANTLLASDVIKIPLLLVKKLNTNGTTIVRLKMSTSATMPSGSTDLIALSPTAAATNLTIGMIKTYFIESGNIKGTQFTGPAYTDNGTGPGVISEKAFDNTVTNYLYVSIQLSSTSDQARLEAMQINNL